MIKIELGGGRNPRPGFINCDNTETADKRVNFELLGRETCARLKMAPVRLPFADNEVDEVYSSHCLEHVHNLGGVWRELMRVCCVGAVIEIRTPAWNAMMAMCYGHVHTISPEQVDHWTRDFPQDWFGGTGKRIQLVNTEYVRGQWFTRWQELFPHARDQDILEMFPNACHENRWTFRVIPYDAPAVRQPGT